jgi:hypothetical protein
LAPKAREFIRVFGPPNVLTLTAGSRRCGYRLQAYPVAGQQPYRELVLAASTPQPTLCTREPNGQEGRSRRARPPANGGPFRFECLPVRLPTRAHPHQYHG